MNILEAVLILSLLALSFFISLFLSLIAKYYHQKSGGGPNPVYLFIYTLLFSAGHVCRLPAIQNGVGSAVSSLLLVAGGLGLIFSAIQLYKSMMSVEKG